ncbi:MAG: polyamine aminopropyltransferase [Mycobacterium leprae]
MELYLTEQQTENQRLSVRVTKTLHQEQTAFQDLAIVETEQWGRLLVLDGFFQTTDKDEYAYHEMGAHVPLFTHPDPKRVLVVGGGDGGIVREVVKHPGVEHIDLVEIDGRVIELSKEYFPGIAVALMGTDKRVHVHVEDGIKWVKDHEAEYDVIVIDSSEPIGPGIGLFTPEFYASVFRALTGDGVMVAQTESPWVNAEVIKMAFSGISQSFPITRLYTLAVPTYPTGLWSFTLGAKRYDPLEADPGIRFAGMTTRYYTPDVHLAAFQLPRFVEAITAEALR